MGKLGYGSAGSGHGFTLRHFAITLSAALLALEGVSSFGLAAPITGFGAVRMTLDVALALALATLAASSIPAPAIIRRLYACLRPVALVGALLLLVFTGLSALNTSQLILLTQPARYYVTDVVAFTDECARLTLAGKNPYTSTTGFAEALRRYPLVTPSPLRGATFGVGNDYPARAVVAAVERRYLAQPASAPEAFDSRTLTSYPALSFLLYLPLVWIGAPDILLLNLLVFLALTAWLLITAPRHQRLWTAMTMSAALPLLLFSLIADTEVVALAFLLIAWQGRRNRWVSGIALGLGCAFRQYCWFFAPFFLFDTLLGDDGRPTRERWREVGAHACIAVGAFLLPNAPYLLASPAAWWRSLWLPVTEPLFPLGVGLVALARGHAAPFAPAAVYTTLEVGALLVCLWAMWRWRPQLREAVPLLALLPLFFAWRSLPNYFAIAPLLALFALATHRRADPHTLGEGIAR